MLEKRQISIRQFTILILMFTMGTSIVQSPNLLAITAKQDAWIAAIIGMSMGLIWVWFYAFVGQYFGGKSLIQIIQTTFGKYLGSFVSFLLICFVILLSCRVLTDLGYFVSGRMLTQTPISPIEYLGLALIALGVRLGLEAIARSFEVILPIYFLLFSFFIIGLIPQVNFENLQPVLENGFTPVWKASVEFFTYPFGELILFLMLIPYVPTLNKIKSGFLWGTLLGGLNVFVIIILAILTLDAIDASQTTYPTYVMAKKIQIGFIERIEIIIAGKHLIDVFAKLMLCIYILTLSLKQLFQLRDTKSLVIPICTLLVPLSQYLIPNYSILASESARWMEFITLGVMFIPVLLITTAWIKRKFSKKQGTS